jgi:hypothetical protein
LNLYIHHFRVRLWVLTIALRVVRFDWFNFAMWTNECIPSVKSRGLSRHSHYQHHYSGGLRQDENVCVSAPFLGSCLVRSHCICQRRIRLRFVKFAIHKTHALLFLHAAQVSLSITCGIFVSHDKVLHSMTSH